MIRHYDRAGHEISMDEMLRLWTIPDYKAVALTETPSYTVSTVWLGIDHGYGYSDKPLIFETMVFLSDEWKDLEREGLHDLDSQRYATEEAALRGHEEFVTLLRATEQSVDQPHEQQERA